MPKVSTILFGDLAILPYQPEVPVRESIEYLTDVIQSFDATEQRFKLRSKPRQLFSYSVPLQAWQQATAWNTQYGAMRLNWAVPIWTESESIGTVTNGQTTIFCNPLVRDFRTGGLAMLFNSCGEYEVLQIGTADTDRIVLMVPSNGMQNAYLIPVRRGWVQGDVDMPTSGYVTKQTINFVIDDTKNFESATPTQYLGDDIYFDIVLLLSNGTIATEMSQQQDIVDMELGPIARRTVWTHAQYGKPQRVILTSPEEIRAYREFLGRRAGKYRRFWLPLFENNMRVTSTGSITTLLSISSDSFIDYASQRTHIVIQANNTWYAREISGLTQVDPAHVQFTLSSTLGGIDAKTITRVSYLGLHRFDSDRIELNWRGNGVVESSVNILELTP